ncbi:regucalcin-like [Belonocnema kinseyi]|uniref:regucalcin-like n=1 Tax=Belonocnema kinseyi TaxID=2817044 RepID=UPI00143D78C7|nr:regucalcin-like [Belonocnema kinseyi]
MRMLLLICAFSAIFYSVICRPSSEYGWSYGGQPSFPYGGQPSFPYGGQPSFPHFSTPALTQWRETVVEESGHSEVAFFRGNQLFFIDTYQQKLCSFHTTDRKTYCAHIGQGVLSFAAPVKSHPKIFVVGCGSNILLIKWDSSKDATSVRHYTLTSAHQPPQDPLPRGSRVGYGTVDYKERLWFVTTNDNLNYHAANWGTVYCMDQNAGIEKKISLLPSVTGGFVWDVPRGKPKKRRSPPHKFYYADTLNHDIIDYNHWLQNGEIERTGVVHSLPKHQVPGDPGRIAIDSNGYLWVPLIGSHRVIQYDPFQEKVLQTILIPAAKVGACIFGGSLLYVSTIGYGENKYRPPGDEGGYIYAIHNLGVTGLLTREYHLHKDIIFRASASLEEISYKRSGRKPKAALGKGSSSDMDLNRSLAD